MAKESDKQYQLKIELEDSKPLIWRRVRVNSADNLVKLHRIIQIAMGWEMHHLHQFIHGGEFYREPSPFGDGGMETLDSNQYRIDSILVQEKQFIRYEYDFGDGWLHKITLEKILPLDDAVALPVCVTGKMACPPEDVGGVWGYGHFLEAIRDEKHPDHEDMKDWHTDEHGLIFDPKRFDLDHVNGILQARRQFDAR